MRIYAACTSGIMLPSRAMMSPAGFANPTKKLASLALGFALAFSVSFTLAKPASAGAGVDACTASCGPAPCCMILWVSWCGCPWGEEQEIQ